MNLTDIPLSAANFHHADVSFCLDYFAFYNDQRLHQAMNYKRQLQSIGVSKGKERQSDHW